MDRSGQGELALHRAGQADPERLHRKVFHYPLGQTDHKRSQSYKLQKDGVRGFGRCYSEGNAVPSVGDGTEVKNEAVWVSPVVNVCDFGVVAADFLDARRLIVQAAQCSARCLFQKLAVHSSDDIFDLDGKIARRMIKNNAGMPIAPNAPSPHSPGLANNASG